MLNTLSAQSLMSFLKILKIMVREIQKDGIQAFEALEESAPECSRVHLKLEEEFGNV